MSVYKLVMLGQAAVGKSSIAERFVKNFFSDNTCSTIGASFLSKSIQLPKETVKLDIWDTAGQERYESLAPIYYRKSNGVIVVYDITDIKSFHMALTWLGRVVDFFGADLPVIYLVGNKSDLEQYRQVYPYNVYSELNLKFNGIPINYIDVSAKIGMGIQQLFFEISNKIYIKTEKELIQDTNVVKLTNKNTQKTKWCCY